MIIIINIIQIKNIKYLSTEWNINYNITKFHYYFFLYDELTIHKSQVNINKIELKT